MPGLKGQTRLPLAADPRLRRNFDGLVDGLPEWISDAQPIRLEDGQFALELATASGLQVVSGELLVKLIANTGLELTADGLGIDLATDPGLEFSSGIRAKVKAGGGVTRDSNGLSVNEGDISGDPAVFTLPTTLQNGDSHNASAWECIRCNLVRSGVDPDDNITINLPDMTSDVDPGDEIIIKRINSAATGGSNVIVVYPDGFEWIDLAAYKILSDPFATIHLMATPTLSDPYDSWAVLHE